MVQFGGPPGTKRYLLRARGLEAVSLIPDDVSLRHGFEVARLAVLVRAGQTRLQEPGADTQSLRVRLDADHLKVPVRLRRMTPSHGATELRQTAR